MILDLAAHAVPVAAEPPAAPEARDVPRRNLEGRRRSPHEKLHVVETDRFGQRREVLDDQLVLQHAGMEGFVDRGRIGSVSAARFGHRDDAAAVQNPVHLGQHVALVRDVVECVVRQDAVARSVFQRDRAAVVGDEPRIERPVRARVPFEQLPAHRDRGRRHVDRDRAAPVPVQKVGQPAGSRAEVDDRVSGPQSGPFHEHARRDQVPAETRRLAERLAEEKPPVRVFRVVPLGRPVVFRGARHEVRPLRRRPPSSRNEAERQQGGVEDRPPREVHRAPQERESLDLHVPSLPRRQSARQTGTRTNGAGWS